MNNKPSFQDSHLLALTAACLAMAAFGCSKTDSLGSVREGGADGVGKDGNGCQSTGANPSKCDAPPAPDASPDTAPDGNACGAGVPVHYSAPGCGADAVPICGAYSQDACTAVISYCACDGQTTVYGACGTSPSPFLYVGACQSVADAPPDPGCQYPLDSHVDATGNTVWWWRFHWQDPNLATTCAAWGADAKIILEVDVPTNPSGSGTTLPTCALDTLSTGVGPQCAMANAWRFEAVCTDSQLMVDLPSIDTFHGYYHVESTTYSNSPRHLVSQDVHCSRDLYLPTGIGSPPATTNDSGVDAPPDTAGCANGYHPYYTAAGCENNAVPVCLSVADAALAITQFCACDGVTTVTDDARGTISPYLYAGSCKKDGGPSTPDVPPSDAPVAFCQLSDGRRVQAGAAYANGCNCCVCTSSGTTTCQALPCYDAGSPGSCQSDQDCNHGNGVCVFDQGCGSPRGTCMSNGACPLFLVSDMMPFEYCDCDGVTYAIVNSSTSPREYPYKPYSHYGACQ